MERTQRQDVPETQHEVLCSRQSDNMIRTKTLALLIANEIRQISQHLAVPEALKAQVLD